MNKTIQADVFSLCLSNSASDATIKTESITNAAITNPLMAKIHPKIKNKICKIFSIFYFLRIVVLFFCAWYSNHLVSCLNFLKQRF